MKSDELLKARELILLYGYNSVCYQIINPGICLHFFKNSVIGYVENNGFRVVAGAPVCAKEDLPEVVNAFEDDALKQNLRVCYFGAESRLADILKTRGPFDRLLLGAQPVWNPANWEAILKNKSSLRAQLNRARNKGIFVSEWKHSEVQNRIEDFKNVLKEWLSTRGLPPLHFLVEPQTLERLYDRRIFVALLKGEIVGFLVASPIPLKNGWLIEQFVRGFKAPNGTAELLVSEAILAFKNSGAEYVTLGLSPLSQRAGFTQQNQSALLKILLYWTRAHGRRFYNFDGLDAFKAKFQPESWEPIYAISSEKHFSLKTLYAIAGAFSGMSPVRLVAQAVLKAVKQEAEWLLNKF
jgi:phosphatidylglycerol lysyltransferase